MGGLRSALALLAIGLALGACQTGRGEPPAVVPAQAAVVMPAVAPAVAEPAPQAAALPPIDDDPAQIMGLDRDGLSNLLGTPDLIRREAPAEIWQYVADDCVFDVVLYQRGTDYAVSYLEARDAAAAILSPRPCLNQLLRARQATPVS
jgi:hypothetical protein